MLGHFRTAMTRQNYAPYLASPAAKTRTDPPKRLRRNCGRRQIFWIIS